MEKPPASQSSGRPEENKQASNARSSDAQYGGAPPAGKLSKELFDALDDIAGVVVELQGNTEHAERAQRLDRAGIKIVDALVREFSLRSAQVELLLDGTDDVEEAWGSYIEKVARRNERLEGGGALA